jgi:hypothetical protein
VLNFAAQGYYNAMALLADAETQSYWDHLTGECVHGELAGQQLQHLGNLLQMTAQEAFNTYPNAQMMLPDLEGEAKETAIRWNAVYRESTVQELDEDLLNTLGTLDRRLPRYDMGLGVWTATTRRYYSVLKLNERDNVIVDTIDGQKVVIYADLKSGLPGAFYIDTADAYWHDDKLHVGNYRTYHMGTLYQHEKRIPLKRPAQIAIRWYGFSFLYPGCEIYE